MATSANVTAVFAYGSVDECGREADSGPGTQIVEAIELQEKFRQPQQSVRAIELATLNTRKFDKLQLPLEQQLVDFAELHNYMESIVAEVDPSIDKVFRQVENIRHLFICAAFRVIETAKYQMEVHSSEILHQSHSYSKFDALEQKFKFKSHAFRVNDYRVMLRTIASKTKKLLSDLSDYVAELNKSVAAFLAEPEDQKADEKLAESGIIMCAGGKTHEVSTLSTTSVFDPTRGTWSKLGALTKERSSSAVASFNGKLVITGGLAADDRALDEAEEFDFTTSKWTALPKLTAGRYSHAMVTVGDSLLVLGGTDGVIYLDSVEEYGSKSLRWSSSSQSLLTQRAAFASAVINDKVVIAGGLGDSSARDDVWLSSCELYSQSDGSTSISSLHYPRANAAAAAHGDNVYVFGGEAYEYLNQLAYDNAEQYDIDTNRWTVLKARMAVKRSKLTANFFNSRIYIVGGILSNNSASALVESFDPKLGHFISVASLTDARSDHSAVSLRLKMPGTEREAEKEWLIVAGGLIGRKTTDSIERFNPFESSWREAAPLNQARSHAAMATLNGKFYITGGIDDDDKALKSVEMCDPKDFTWKTLNPMLSERYSHCLLSFHDKLFALGGRNSGSHLNTCDSYDPRSNTWSRCASMVESRDGLAACATKHGFVIAGGIGGSKALSFACLKSCELYEPSAGKSKLIGQLKQPRSFAVAASVSDCVYVFGGQNEADSIEILGTVEQSFYPYDKWTTLETRMKAARSFLACVSLSNRIYVLGGWLPEERRTDIIECFDPLFQKFNSTLQKPMPSICSGHAAAAIEEKVGQYMILFSGWNGKQLFEKTQLYDPASKSWKQAAPAKTMRLYAAAAAVNGKIIVAGGRDADEKPLNSAEQYDPVKNEWQSLQNMKTNRFSHVLVAVDAMVFAIGGRNRLEQLKPVECYNVVEEKWHFSSPLEDCRDGPTAAVCNNRIYLMGGKRFSSTGRIDYLSSCEIYNPTAKSEPVESMKIARVFAAAASYLDSIFVFGGSCESPSSNTIVSCSEVEMYNTIEKKWTMIEEKLRVGRSYLSAACVGDQIYVVGGWYETDNRSDLVEQFDPRQKKFVRRRRLSHALSGHVTVSFQMSLRLIDRL